MVEDRCPKAPLALDSLAGLDGVDLAGTDCRRTGCMAVAGLAGRTDSARHSSLDCVMAVGLDIHPGVGLGIDHIVAAGCIGHPADYSLGRTVAADWDNPDYSRPGCSSGRSLGPGCYSRSST